MVCRDVGALIKGIFGGEIKIYTKLLADTRKEAENLSADAIIGLRSVNIQSPFTEILCYGTAVKFEE